MVVIFLACHRIIIEIGGIRDFLQAAAHFLYLLAAGADAAAGETGRLLSLSLAERCGETLIIHIEKALYSCPGVYPATVQSFAQTFGQGSAWINREDDAADRGLRTSKLQYGPAELGSKYNFAPRNELITHVKAIPELKTERLTLTALREEDIPAYNALVLDTERNRWWGYDDVGGLTEPQTERSFYDVAQRDFAARSAVNFAVRLDGQFIGEAVLYRFDYRGGAELGCRVAPAFAGHGYGTEAFAAVVEDVAAAVRGLLTGQRRAQVMQQGAVVVLAGAVNAGKSSLLNALLGRNRALVTDIPGTTRDFLEESCQLDGLPVRLTDTAGLRETDESVEEMGVALSRQKVRQADAILLLVDGGRLGPAGAAADICPDEAVREVLEQAGDIPVLLVWNKVDLAKPAVWPPVWGHGRPCVRISASTGHNVDTLARRLRALLLDDGSHTPPSDGLAPNARQSLVLEHALHELDALLADIAAGSPYDCCSVRLDAAAALLGEVTGLDSPEEVLNRVFSSFCIGK